MAIADLVKTTLGPKGMVRALRTLNRKSKLSHLTEAA
jgi:chaperonin GroEL (HSP60 family)